MASLRIDDDGYHITLTEDDREHLALNVYTAEVSLPGDTLAWEVTFRRVPTGTPPRSKTAHERVEDMVQRLGRPKNDENGWPCFVGLGDNQCLPHDDVAMVTLCEQGVREILHDILGVNPLEAEP